MPSIIDQIDTFSFRKTRLFYDQDRLGEEVKLNLASFPGNRSGISNDQQNEIIGALQKALTRMEIELASLVKNRKAVFYLWHDEQARQLRWAIISDFGQTKLPFSSNVTEVGLEAVIKDWGKPQKDSNLLTMSEIEKMTPAELSKSSRSKGVPIIDVFVRRIGG